MLQQFDSLTQAIRRLDVERMLSFYSQDTLLVRALDGRPVIGRRAVEKDFREGFAAVQSFDRLELTSRYLAALGTEAAVLTVELDEQFTDTTGCRMAVRAVWTSTWQLHSGRWRIAQDAAIHLPLGSTRDPRCMVRRTEHM